METGWKRNVLIIYCMERKNNMMRPLHIIMPMAGEGSRFRKEGWTTPKPLIELNEMPLFVRAIQSVAISDVRMKYSFRSILMNMKLINRLRVFYRRQICSL